ncbi:RagB/SusD family nutrient uptake outer membrane protein [Reichenbachiella ulvae]|uniref:RagB/SusD family nutrient uptake outer membrane protein n=1 Tax=Reichenbachiella ulvae TaxID=2980104 RepID=A0ABT3CPN0_9BACT|nr:RagB/SusD family nutrient uptake outer membrane protein [Reichenbachiella ulvae]MCV9385228.1 RagB/SusD family nutrient uptake outer membrane protein [Reichenbachiella ulvae]
MIKGRNTGMKIFEAISKLQWVLVLTVLVSCEDHLDLEPTDAISDQKVFESYAVANTALTGVYDQLSSYTFDGLYLPIMSDIMGEDLMINSVDNWNWFTPVYQMELLPNYSYIDEPWWAGYKVISDASKIIHNVRVIPDATEEQINNMEGQARVLRAYAMYKLTEFYAPSFAADSTALSILIVTEGQDADSENKPRAALYEVYNQIENDLMIATSLLEMEEDKGFFDQRAAKAILARLYLNKRDWAKARDMAKEAHDGLDLMTVNDMYSGYFARNSESIFSIAYTQDDNNVYLSIPSFYWPVGGYSSMRAHNQFVSQFSSQDSRRNLMGRYSELDPNRFVILKFAHNSVVGNAERIAIRASEMHLIEAECEAELGNYTQAQDALYRIQRRANPAATKSTTTGQSLIDEILLERRKELFGEGFRLNDIKRRLLPLQREEDHWVTFNFSSDDEDYYRLTFPIPQSEIDANDKVTDNHQNIGY